MAAVVKGRSRRWPIHGWIGIGLIALFWPLNWLLTGLRTHWGFFPLWLGYALTVDALALGGLICGFFWELWNSHSYPKWIYRIPYADVLPLFEMPLPGYLGYIPFSLELFALYHLLAGFLSPPGKRQDLRLFA